jgi:membrane protein implicated in regulation of membrane protease activity
VSALGFLIAWANAPFAIAAGVAALFALLQVTGVLGLLAGGGDHDVDADVDHDVDADVDHDVDHDAEHDGADRGWGIAALAPLGVGKIPFSVIWQTYALAFALCGFGMNLHYLGGALRPPLVTLAWTLPSSMVVGYLAVALVAKVLGPVLSSKAQEATSRAQLVGQIGVVISSKVDQEFGEIRIRDKDGHDIRIVCKLPKGSTRPVPEHRSVVVVEVDDERGELFVEPFDDEDAGARDEGSKLS